MASESERPRSHKRKLQDVLDDYNRWKAEQNQSALSTKRPRLIEDASPPTKLQSQVVNTHVVDPKSAEQPPSSPRAAYKDKSYSKHDMVSHSNANCSTELPTTEDEEMAIEVLERLLEHMRLQKKVSELTAQVQTLLKENSAEKDKYDRLWPQYEQAYEDRLIANANVSEKNKEIQVEISRNEKHVDTIATLTLDLKKSRKENERLTGLNDGRKHQVKQLTEHIDAQTQSIEHQRALRALQPRPDRSPTNSTGLLVLEFYMYHPLARRFKLKGTRRTDTTEVTDWAQLWRVSKKHFTPEHDRQDTIAQVQDIMFADTFVSISPRHFVVWLECLKVQMISERRCRCLWFPRNIPREDAHELARSIQPQRP